MEQTRNMIKLPIESCITVSRDELINKLTETLNKDQKAPFMLLCNRINNLIKSSHEADYEELLKSYRPFDPHSDGIDVSKTTELVSQEHNFLQKFSQLMDTGKYKRLSDHEWKVATSSHYLLNLRIKIDRSKLDNALVSNIPGATVDDFCKGQFVIFRKGVDMQYTSGYFILLKLHMLQLSLINFFVCICSFGGRKLQIQQSYSSVDDKVEAGENSYKYQEVERYHVDDIRISNLFKRARLQEPKYEHVVVLYRHSGSHRIHIKHYRDVPMADMELVLPAKKTPRPSASVTVKFIASLIIGSVVYSLVDVKQHLAASILTVCMLYCAKLLISFLVKVREYKKMLKNKLVRDKRLPKHQGVLVNLYRDAVDEEVKMVILVYYVLLTKVEGLSKEVIGIECMEVMEKMFKKKCIFQVDNTLASMQKLKIIQDAPHHLIHHLPLEDANQVTDVPINHLK